MVKQDLTPLAVRAWREQIAWRLPTTGLEHARHALQIGTHDIMQGITVGPLWGGGPATEAPKCACLLGYVLWKAFNLKTNKEVMDAWLRLRDLVCKSSGGYDWTSFSSWFDAYGRDYVWAKLVLLVDEELRRRRDEGDVSGDELWADYLKPHSGVRS